jgi:hypothetical protein
VGTCRDCPAVSCPDGWDRGRAAAPALVVPAPDCCPTVGGATNERPGGSRTDPTVGVAIRMRSAGWWKTALPWRESGRHRRRRRSRRSFCHCVEVAFTARSTVSSSSVRRYGLARKGIPTDAHRPWQIRERPEVKTTDRSGCRDRAACASSKPS